jgi:flagellar hook-associated protein 3 FlgL
MSLRTPNPFTNIRTTLDLQRVKEHLAVLQEQISTGKRIVRLGDDPTGAALIVDFRSSIERNKQYVKQADSASSFLQATETSLDGVDTAITRLLELGQQALSDTTGASGRTQIAQEVDATRNNLLTIANAQQQGKYLFAGSATTTAPFTPTATGATYNGNNATISLDVGVSTSVATNDPGDTVFFGQSAALPPTATAGPGSAGDLFTQVTALRDALNTNNYAGIQAAYTNLQSIHSRLQNTFSELGGRQSALDQLKETVGSFNTSLQSVQDTYEAVDLPQAITDYQKEGLAPQATLSVLGRSNQQNLFNYLT